MVWFCLPSSLPFIVPWPIPGIQDSSQLYQPAHIYRHTRLRHLTLLGSLTLPTCWVAHLMSPQHAGKHLLFIQGSI